MVTLGALAPHASACSRPVAAMDCCAAEAAGEAPRLERACCCVEVPDEKPVRTANLAGVRPGHDGGVELARVAEAIDLPRPTVREHLPPPRPAPRPPPTLLEARTTFLC